MTYVVSRETGEDGIRVALGGALHTVRRQVLWSAVRIAVVGSVVGALLGAVGGRLIANQLFGVPARDPGLFAAGRSHWP